MSEVIGVVDVVAAEGKADEVVAAFEACMTATHQEEGCLTYALHRDNANPNHFVHVERWRSQADLDAHFKQPHMAPIAQALELLAEPPQIYFCEPVEVGDASKGLL